MVIGLCTTSATHSLPANSLSIKELYTTPEISLERFHGRSDMFAIPLFVK